MIIFSNFCSISIHVFNLQRLLKNEKEVKFLSLRIE